MAESGVLEQAARHQPIAVASEVGVAARQRPKSPSNSAIRSSKRKLEELISIYTAHSVSISAQSSMESSRATRELIRTWTSFAPLVCILEIIAAVVPPPRARIIGAPARLTKRDKVAMECPGKPVEVLSNDPLVQIVGDNSFVPSARNRIQLSQTNC